MHFFDKARARWVSFFGKGDDNAPVTAAEFTQEFLIAYQEVNPAEEFSIVADLEIKSSHTSNAIFLQNAYGAYLKAPDQKAAIIANWVASFSEVKAGSETEVVDRSCIVPVIKDRLWLEESMRNVRSRSGESFPEIIHEIYNDELVILYAEDTEHNVRYLNEERLAATGVARQELRELAVDNLRRLLPPITAEGLGELVILSAGGVYESSLILLGERLWNSSSMQEHILGEILLAMPARDALLLTGTENPGGLDRMRSVVAQVMADDPPYRLTPRIFVYRDGRFEVFE